MKVIKFSEHILVSLGLLAVMMAGVFILLISRGLRGWIGDRK